ncbi:hypothetical protein F5880DRAFT_1619420 [Lentinula raphanica]|nr:hypothetical protein F5880DRAFT_1619420 [Lentinula raphanica]
MEGDPTLIGDATFADTKSKDDFHTFATNQRHRLPYEKNSLIPEFMQEAALDDVVWELAKFRSYLLDWVYLHQLMTHLHQNGMITEATLVVWTREMARRVKDLEEFKKAKRVKNKKAYAKSTSRRTQQGVLPAPALTLKKGSTGWSILDLLYLPNMLLSVSPYLGLETQRAFKSPSCLLFAILLVSQLFSIDVIARPLRPLVPAPPPAPAPPPPVPNLHAHYVQHAPDHSVHDLHAHAYAYAPAPAPALSPATIPRPRVPQRAVTRYHPILAPLR